MRKTKNNLFPKFSQDLWCSPSKFTCCQSTHHLQIRSDSKFKNDEAQAPESSPIENLEAAVPLAQADVEGLQRERKQRYAPAAKRQGAPSTSVHAGEPAEPGRHRRADKLLHVGLRQLRLDRVRGAIERGPQGQPERRAEAHNVQGPGSQHAGLPRHGAQGPQAHRVARRASPSVTAGL